MPVATALRHFASIASRMIVLSPAGQSATIVQPPFRFPTWPDLNPTGNNATNAVTGLEVPQYVWYGPNGRVQNPVTGETAVFQRAFNVAAAGSNNRLEIPAGTRRFVLNIAADNRYTFALDRLSAQTLSNIMSGSQGIGLGMLTWRNVKLFESTPIATAAGDVIILTVAVTNNPMANGTAESNPAMLTWSMYVF